jgi:hypothetical protein
MECRLSPRQKRTIRCEIEHDGERLPGEVLDVSAKGLFVRTETRPGVGTELALHLDATRDSPAMSLDCAVVRVRMPEELAQVVVRGVGLRLISIPDEWTRLVAAGPDCEKAAPTPRAEADAARDALEDEVPTVRVVTEIHLEDGEAMPLFRVRVNNPDLGRYRMLTLEAKSEPDAENAAVVLLGPGWEVVEVDPLAPRR